MSFGKVNRSVAFNPTSAFPLDARSYFESYEAAALAAASAEPVGSTNTQYYIGQTLVVVENGKDSTYIIQPTKSLEVVEKDIQINENLFEYDENGKLTLAGAASAAPGTQPILNADGSLSWIAPINAYTKSEVYTKSETDTKIAEEVAAASHLKRKVVASVDAIDKFADDAEQYIYMVPALEGLANDVYDEYIVIDQEIEKVGSWEVDLTDYAKTADVNLLLDGKVDKAEGSRLMTDAEGQKLASIKDLIQEVNPIDFILNNGKLDLNSISISKVSNLEDILNKKVDTIEGWTLLSPTNQEKLSKLVISDDGTVEISGTVNAENVQGLGDWITGNVGSIIGLSEKNFTSELEAKLNGIQSGAERNYVSSVDENQLKVNNGRLSITAVDSSLVGGLEALLAGKASVASVDSVKTSVNDLERLLNNYKVSTNARLDEIEDSITWHTIN